jgi:hypothetical protein
MEILRDEIIQRFRYYQLVGPFGIAVITAFGLYNIEKLSHALELDQTSASVAIILVGLAYAIVYLYALRRAHEMLRRNVRQIVEEEDADSALVNKIAKAVRPSLASTFFVNTIFFVLGLIAAAYTPEVRVFLDKIGG